MIVRLASASKLGVPQSRKDGFERAFRIVAVGDDEARVREHLRRKGFSDAVLVTHAVEKERLTSV